MKQQKLLLCMLLIVVPRVRSAYPDDNNTDNLLIRDTDGFEIVISEIANDHYDYDDDDYDDGYDRDPYDDGYDRDPYDDGGNNSDNKDTSPFSHDDWSQFTCEKVHEIPTNQQCRFVLSQCKEHQIGLINYFKIYYCSSDSSSIKNLVILPAVSLILLYLFISLGLTASEFLCPNLSSISNFLKIPENISGLTLLAFGNGSPDIMSTYSSFQSNNAPLAIGELIGAAFFITCFIIGMIAVFYPFNLLPTASINDGNENDENLDRLVIKNDKLIYLRDLIFFLISMVLVLVLLSDGKLTKWKFIVLVSVYLLYVFVILIWQWLLNVQRSKLSQTFRIRNMFNDNLTLDIHSDDGFEFEDRYSFNPMILNNIEFGSILNNLTKKQSIKFRLSKFSSYRDDLQEYESRLDPDIDLDDNDLENDRNVNLQLINNQQDQPEDNIFKKLFNGMTLPIFLILKYSLPLMSFENYNTELKLTFTELFTLLSSIFISQFIFSFSFIEEPTVFTYLFSITLHSAIIYVVYNDLITKKGQQKNQSNLIKLLISSLGFIASISCISVIAEELINVLKFISILTKMSDAILGLTVFAIGNSVGDLISNLIISKLGYPLMALAACFGGPLLNLLLGIGMNGLIVGETIHMNMTLSLYLSCLWVLVNLIFILIYVPFNGWKFDRFVGLVMIGIWCVGTVINIIVEII